MNKVQSFWLSMVIAIIGGLILAVIDMSEWAQAVIAVALTIFLVIFYAGAEEEE
jgi:hypothetical protein